MVIDLRCQRVRFCHACCQHSGQRNAGSQPDENIASQLQFAHTLNNMKSPRVALIALLFAAHAAVAQAPKSNVTGGCEVPVGKRTAENGCYLLATESLATLPAREVYWHLYTYPTQAAADAARKGSAGTVVESLGKVWLFAIADSKWRPASGERVAAIGPLSVAPAKSYTARYMEAVFPPRQGMRTSVHNHSGPEAWYVVTGTQCLRTPEGVQVIRAGEGGFVRAGPSMMLTSIGTEVRRAVVLVLHDSSEPWMTSATDWTPTTECPEA
jgi:quercetin dioxygenase-like cupin family protein